MYRFPGFVSVIGLFGWVALAAVLGATPATAASPASTTRDLVRADRATLDALYAGGTVNPVPTGFLPGRVIVSPGSRVTVPASRILHPLWQGKVFHGDGTAHNRTFGVNAVPMKVYEGTSWRDGEPAIIVDYADSWRRFSQVRDELREVSPGLYLGVTYLRKDTGPKEVMMFTLHAPRR